MNKQFRVTLESSSKEITDTTLSINTHGISSETLMLKAMPEGLDFLSTAFITVASGVSADLLARWIYDKVKENSHEKTVINGNQINAENVTINQFRQILNCPPNHKDKKKNSKKLKKRHRRKSSKN